MVSDEPELDVERQWAVWVARTLGGSARQRGDAAIAATRVGLMGGTQVEAMDAAQAAWQQSLMEASLAQELETAVVEDLEEIEEIEEIEETEAEELAVDARAVSQETVEHETADWPAVPETEAARAQFVLGIVGGPEEFGTAFPIPAGETTIGRDADRDIQLEDESVSHKHAVIAVIDARVTIWDVGSTNGTRVNDRYIDKPIELNVGDTIGLGDTRLVLEWLDPEAEHRFERGWALHEQGRHQEALAAFEHVAESEHRFLAGRGALAAARIWAQLGNQAAAMRHYDRAIEVGQGDTAGQAALDLGELLAQRGELEKAIEAFDQAARLGDDETRSAAERQRRKAREMLGHH